MFNESADLYDKIYSWKNYKQEAEEITAAILARMPGCRTILDVACGTGEHHVYLKEKFEIDGTDILGEFIEIAKPKNPAGNYFQADMRNFDLERKYDAVICLFSSIGYLKNTSEIKSAFLSFAKHLKPGGIVMVEPWFTKESWTSGKVHMIANDHPDFKICRMNMSMTEGDYSIVDFQYLIGEENKGIKHFTERHELRLSSVDEMLSAFKEAGLKAELDPKGLTGRGMYYAKPYI